MRRSSPSTRPALAVFVAAASLLTGCYQRTVSSKGVGATGTRSQDSYRSDTALDRWYDRTFTDTSKSSTKTHWVNPGSTTNVTNKTADSYPNTNPR